MKPKKTIVTIEDGSVFRCDTVMFSGRKWLVSGQAKCTEQLFLPTFLMEGRLAYRLASPDYGADYVLRRPIPTAVWHGQQVDPRYVMVKRARATLGYPQAAARPDLAGKGPWANGG